MAIIFDGFKSKNDVLSTFKEKSAGQFEIVFAFKNKNDDYFVLAKKGTKFYYTIGNLIEDDPQSLFSMMDTIDLKDLRSMFSNESWYKKNKIDIENNFEPVKESFKKFSEFLKV